MHDVEVVEVDQASDHVERQADNLWKFGKKKEAQRQSQQASFYHQGLPGKPSCSILTSGIVSLGRPGPLRWMWAARSPTMSSETTKRFGGRMLPP